MRCEYRYKDGAQCVAKIPSGQKICDAHDLLTRMAQNQKRQDDKKRQARKKEKPVIVLKKVAKKTPARTDSKGAIYDHSAPWRCSMPNCEECSGKPEYDTYMGRRKGS